MIYFSNHPLFFLIDGIQKYLPKNEKNGIWLMELKT